MSHCQNLNIQKINHDLLVKHMTDDLMLVKFQFHFILQNFKQML